MPGIIPMKVIKVGTSAQSRIAQACDRCRSKKIRCDGFRPCCSQCANVGFECKTSDKLSRRAFPRGYTESLEERVRALETENRELKDLLDEKDEKIDMLSKMHSHSPHGTGSPRRPSSISSNERRISQDTAQQEKEEFFKIQQSSALVDGENTDPYFVGSSSTRAFIDSFKRILQENGKPCADLKTDNFFPSPSKAAAAPSPELLDSQTWTAPPRLLSDQMINLFFQEWATLFPVLHRPTFLATYEQYVTDSDAVRDKKSLAQLNLVFCIATLSNENRITYDTSACEKQWLTALDSFITETSLSNLQCLILAQIHCIQKGDVNKLLHYKSLAFGISQRLGLHLSQKRFALGALTVETRKKAFWTLYTLDCFSAAYLGLPKTINEDDILCEYPADMDDEYVTEKGFQQAAPGESTRLSSALALFRASRVLGKVLAINHPTAGDPRGLSFRSVTELDEELEAWSKGLPPHLRLEFAQDKPSTNVISSRCPLLSLTYNYIRVLIHRPAVCSSLGSKASSSNVATASANKRIIQILQLLDERDLSFSHCINKNELLLSSGFGLLVQSLEFEKEGKLKQDSRKLAGVVGDMLLRRDAPGATDFRNLSKLILPTEDTTTSDTQSTTKKAGSTGTILPATSTNGHKQLAALTARYTLESAGQPTLKSEKDARQSSSGSSPVDKSNRRPSEKSLRPLAPSTTHQKTLSPISIDTPASDSSSKASPKQSRAKATSLPGLTPNLDYFSFSNDAAPHPPQQKNPADSSDPTVWERLLHTLGTSHYNSEEPMYDWPSAETFLQSVDADIPSQPAHWSSNTWNSSGESLCNPIQPTHSVLSFSDESLTSGEEFNGVELRPDGDNAFRGVMIPHFTPETYSPAGGAEVEVLQNDSIA